ncbi:hypothetical protein [Alteraurantiacibacter buctensis]|uniref:Uncharacterized protein n=1 Tax=Alteraurantiacibacter buctensis TaxID=1503981 RepID=A0A844Z0T8_9SPHN|nr:hypothetical protein [Alteraurantiacibacter buctensis]MXO72876.1 hypothetical protein [Alteraurantiacibacter buctensis]
MEAANAPAPVSVDEKAADFENYLFGDEDEQDDQSDSDEEAADEGEDLELDEEQADEADEPELPAIDPPVSLTAEEKATFAQLPPEAQAAWAASETRRNAQVQEATTKASNAQRDAEVRAAQADAQAKARYAEQLKAIGEAYAPQMPQRQHYRDDVSYLTARDAYRDQLAQHNDFMQQVAGLESAANSEDRQAFEMQRERELMAIPEIANPQTREGYFAKAFSAMEALGYDPAMKADLTAQDVRNLAQVAEWQEKAAKFDKATARQMQKVRAAKGKSLRPNAAPQGKTRAASADQAFQRIKASGKNRDAQGAAMADWLEAQGIL